jgi:hypothetical protein
MDQRQGGRLRSNLRLEGHSVGYADLYDAYFCHDCNEWLEERCKDPACEECAERPDRPLL